ncbi:hypothetical protein [Pueribacillus sp. YX66]|uniref:hypothetical protein n=1 Tax=Pueribacillus sp. YX66 TaxID=3229242 RepID=UPI00358CF91A
MNGKKINRNEMLIWIIVSLFTILLLWKIAVTPFKIDFSVLITFLLALFSISMSLFYYLKINVLLNEVRELLQSKVDKHHIQEVYKEEKSKKRVQSEELDPTIQIEFEERTLKLKEEEREELLERLIQRAGLDEEEKKVYISQLEKVDNDLFNIRSNLNHLRKKINQSFSEMFVLEKTKLVREIIDQLGPKLVNEGSFVEINERFKMLSSNLPKATVDFLEENAHIDNDGSLTRKGYREFTKVAKKML